MHARTKGSEMLSSGPTLLSCDDIITVACGECGQEVRVTKKCPLCGHPADKHEHAKGGRDSQGVFCQYYDKCHCVLDPHSFFQNYADVGSSPREQRRQILVRSHPIPGLSNAFGVMHESLLRLDAKPWLPAKRERPDKKYLVQRWAAPETTTEIVTAQSGSEALEQYRTRRGWVSKRDSKVKLLREGDQVIAGKIVSTKRPRTVVEKRA